MIAESPEPIASGTVLGHYVVRSRLGSGGMGEVYEAHDSHLNRSVALKVVRRDVASDAIRRERLKREASAAAMLNHPHIVTLHSIEEGDDTLFLTMELVEGSTLTDMIPAGGLVLDRFLSCAIQLADALQAAHGRGVIHRDLKPANIMVTPDGVLKVLDFGLSKIAIDQAAGPVTTESLTVDGKLVGTAPYMAPEQIEGKGADARADIFSLGIVLFEMATGRRPFGGDTPMATLTAILRDDPPLASAVRADFPEDLARVIDRCLLRDPARRTQTAADLRNQLEDLSRMLESGRWIPTPSSGVASPQRDRGGQPHSRLRDIGDTRHEIEETLAGLRARGTNRVRVVAMAAGTLAVLAIGAAWWTRSLMPPVDRDGPASLPATFSPLTDQPGPELYASLSPDGNFFVYQSRAAGQWDVYVQRVRGRNPVNLTKDSMADDIQPAFSPDGERIAFRSERDGGGIFVMGATGEDARRLTDFGYNPVWSPDGSEMIITTGWFLRPEDAGTSTFGQLFRVNVATGEKRLVTGTFDAKQPHWSPHGDRVAYWQIQGGQRDIWTVAASGGDPVSVTNDPYVDWNPVWSPDGRYLYFSSDRGGSMNLWRVRIDEQSGKTLGALEPVTTPSPSSGFVSFSRDGRQLAYVQLARNWNVYNVAFDPSREGIVGQPVPVTQGSKEFAFPDVSPDGRWIAFTSRLKPEDVFTVKADGTGLRQLTDDTFQDRTPRWSPDGKRIAFMSNRTGNWQVWTIKPDGSGLEQLTDAPGNGAAAPTWSPDGARLLGQPLRGARSFVIQTGKPWKGQSAEPLPASESGAEFIAWSWSADGRKLAGYLQREDGSSDGVTVYSLEAHTYERLAPVGDWPHWLPDSRRLIFHYQGKAYLIDSQSKKMHEVLSVVPHEVSQQFGVSRDGRMIVFTLDATEADVWHMSLE